MREAVSWLRAFTLGLGRLGLNPSFAHRDMILDHPEPFLSRIRTGAFQVVFRKMHHVVGA